MAQWIDHLIAYGVIFGLAGWACWLCLRELWKL